MYEELFLPADLSPVLESNAVHFTIGATSATQQTDEQTPDQAGSLTLHTISPNVIEAGMADTALVPLTLTGSGFTAESTVHWQNNEFTSDLVPLPTTFVSATQLKTVVPANFTAAAGRALISVSDSSTTSNTLVFTIAPGMYVSSISPAQVTVNSTQFTLSVTGVGFTALSQVYWNSQTQHKTLATTKVSDTQLTATVPTSLLTSAETVQISVRVGTSVAPNNKSVVQFPPRLLQAARLKFDMLSATDDSKV
ncbi:MAG: hypothetical protein D3910_02225, partial [Candidatus Electrothrix sp. ATG2]|nr:hypothetical protein [Candidatus Electrothrix sp. ATG2]